MKAKQAYNNLGKVINKAKLNILQADKETTMEYTKQLRRILYPNADVV